MRIFGFICGTLGVLLVGLALPVYDVMLPDAFRYGGIKIAIAIIFILVVGGLALIFLGRWMVVHHRATTYDPRPDAPPPTPEGPRLRGKPGESLAEDPSEY